MKKIISICICALLIFSSFNMVIAESTAVLPDVDNIKSTIEEFFKDYEAAVGNEDVNFKDMDKTFDGDLANKTLIKTVLNRKVTLDKGYPNGTLKELNKKLEFDYTSIEVNGENAEVEVSVTKSFNYNITPDVPSGERNKYTIKLVKGNVWKIVFVDGFIDTFIKQDFEGKNIKPESINDLNTYNANLKQNVSKFYAELSKEMSVKKSNNSPVTLEKNNIISPMATTYNRNGAAQYAIDHAYNYNTNYAAFTGGLGGDCTNFISQCLYEGGGIPEHFGTAYTETCWYYTTSTNRSSSWTGATEFNRYVKSSVSKISIQMSTFDSVQMGDIIQLGTTSEPYHSLIITGVVLAGANYRSDLLFCCHSSDKQNYSLVNTFGSATKQYIHIIGGK